MTERRCDLRVAVAGGEAAVDVWESASVAAAGPEVVLVHGGAAGRHWWDHLVPHLRSVRRIVALDLSGHGDSGHREVYSLDDWSEEVRQVAAELCDGPPLLVGHSMGGLVCVNAAQHDPGSFRGVLALDSPLARNNAGNIERRRKIAARPPRSFDTYEEALAGFRTAPPTTAAPAEVMRHVAAGSVRPDAGRWRLKFDPRIYDRPQVEAGFLRKARVPTWWVRAEHGFIDEPMAATIATEIGAQGRMIWAPGATHHLILDQPRETAWTLNTFTQVLGRSS